MSFDYFDVVQDGRALKEMLRHSKGKRLVPVIVEDGRVYVGYGGGF